MKKQICPQTYSHVFSAVSVRIFPLGLLAVLALGAVASGFPQVSSAAAQSQVGTNQRVQLEGELEILHQDFKDGHGRFIYFLKLADGTRVPIHFVKHPPTHLLTGDRVLAKGQLSGDSLVLYSGSTSLTKTTTTSTTTATSSSIPVPNTFGSQSV